MPPPVHVPGYARNDNRLFFSVVSDEPEYLICLQCETPTYQFEFHNDKVISVVCNTCGADDPSDFVTEAEFQEEE